MIVMMLERCDEVGEVDDGAVSVVKTVLKWSE